EGGRDMENPSDLEPPCPGCTKISNDRKTEGKRATAIGKLRPDIVLYDEEDPRAESTYTIAQHDQSLRPDALLIMGMSLATHGVQLLIRDFAKIIHKRQTGKVVFVNRTKPAKSWTDVIDYWVESDCDAWVRDLVERQSTLCCGNDRRQVRDHFLGIDKPYLEDARLIPKVLVDLTEDDEQLTATPLSHTVTPLPHLSVVPEYGTWWRRRPPDHVPGRRLGRRHWRPTGLGWHLHRDTHFALNSGVRLSAGVLVAGGVGLYCLKARQRRHTLLRLR
ncbi:hypothetical protein C7999DRAFT_18495, partial [Corynascus novoguineensis]